MSEWLKVAISKVAVGENLPWVQIPPSPFLRERVIVHFLRKYKNDICCFGIITLLFAFYVFCTWGKWGVVTYDCGREVYLPQLLLQGKLLYKEIFAMYNPLSYQFNAVLYWLFGASFNTLYWAGIINAYLCLIATYLISRQLLSPLKAAVPSLLFLCLYISKLRNCIEYIFPYSYGMVYATSTFLFFVLFAILFIKNNKIHFTYLASLLLGLSFANRFEFALAYIPFIVYLGVKNKTLKHIMGNILLFLLPIVCSYGLLFLQGFTFLDLFNYIEFGQRFFNTVEQKYYEEGGYNIFALFHNWKIILSDFLLFLLMLLVNIPLIKVILEQKRRAVKIILILFYSIVLLTFNTALVYFDLTLQYTDKYYLLSWSGLSVFYILYRSIKSNDKNRTVIIMLSLFCICSSIRLGFIYVNDYLIFMSVLALIINVAYFLELKIKDIYKVSVAVFLILLCVHNFFANALARNYEQIEIKSTKGSFYLIKEKAIILNEALSWINENTKLTDTVLVLPEGPMLNFITGRPTNNMYYHLIPNHISALVEEKIVVDLNNNKPEYIVLQRLSYVLYGKEWFGKDFGLQIFDFIKKNYRVEKVMYDGNEGLQLIIFSKNN